MKRPAPTSRRLPDWPERLADLLDTRLAMPFAWGSHDCATFAADGAVAVCGADPMAHLRGQWTTEAEAEAVISALGGLEAAADDALRAIGAVDCPPALAQRGDLALFLTGNMPALGVIEGADVVAPGFDGLRRVPVAAATRAWAL
jgi:hypothetical protein